MRLLFLLLFSACCFGAAASDTLYKKKTFRIRLLTTTDSLIQGFLHRVGDSSLFISGSALPYGQLPAGHIYEIGWQRISVMQVKRKGRVGRGILFGSLSGLAAGALIGLASYEKPDCTICFDSGPFLSAAITGTTGFIGGALIGTAAGAASKKEFIIEGAWERFAEMKAAMEMKVRRTK